MDETLVMTPSDAECCFPPLKHKRQRAGVTTTTTTTTTTTDQSNTERWTATRTHCMDDTLVMTPSDAERCFPPLKHIQQRAGVKTTTTTTTTTD